MAFSFGSALSAVGSFLGGGGFKDVLTGASLLGSAALEHRRGRQEARAQQATVRQLERQQQANSIQERRAAEARNEERERALGTIRARLAAGGVDVGRGTAAHLLRLTERTAEKEEEDARRLAELEEMGLTDAISGARSAARSARRQGTLGAGLSLIGAVART